MRLLPAALLLGLLPLLAQAAPAAEPPAEAPFEAPDHRGFDPTGVWYGLHGPLVLMRAGDTLSFSYSAVFGATAHTCDGIGIAGFVGDGRWEYTDAEGTVTFTTRDDEVTMNVTDGIASFCGAYWPGDRFVRDGWKPPFSCVVTAAKAHFHVVEPPPPGQRYGYVLAGDRVEAAGLVSEGGAAWLLARYVGERTTAGLLAREALACEEE